MKLQALQEVTYVGEKNWYVSLFTQGRSAEKIRDVGVFNSPHKAIQGMTKDFINYLETMEDWADDDDVELDNNEKKKISSYFKHNAFKHTDGTINVIPDRWGHEQLVYIANTDTYKTEEDYINDP